MQSVLASLLILHLCFLLFRTSQGQTAPPPTNPRAVDPPLPDRARAIIEGNSLAASLGFFRLVALQRNVFIRDACDLRLCFALDGSNSITRADYELQKDFVKLVASVANVDGATSSAVQYGTINEPISARTGDASVFRSRVDASKFQASDGAFIGAGLGFCITDVQMGRPGDGRKVILLGNGRGDFASTFLEQVLSALKRGDELLAVGVGKRQNVSALVEATGGKPGNFYSIAGENSALDVVVTVMRRICRLDD